MVAAPGPEDRAQKKHEQKQRVKEATAHYRSEKQRREKGMLPFAVERYQDPKKQDNRRGENTGRPFLEYRRQSLKYRPNCQTDYGAQTCVTWLGR